MNAMTINAITYYAVVAVVGVPCIFALLYKLLS